MADHWGVLRIAGNVWVLFVFSQSLAAQEVDTSFDEALRAATNYPVRLGQADSVEHSISLFEKIISEYKDHPRLDEVKLAEHKILAMPMNDAYFAKANELIREVMSHTSVESPLGREARLAYVEFQVDNARHFPFEDLKHAAAVLEEMEAGLDPKSIDRARWIEHKSMLLRREEKYVEALATVVEYYRETYTWPEEMWKTMLAENPEQYREFRRMFMFLNNEMIQTMGSAKDPQVSVILRNAPQGVTMNPFVHEAWKKFEERYITDGQTYEGMVDSMMQATLESIWEDAEKGTIPSASRNQSSAGADSLATPAGPATRPATTREIQSSIGWPVGISAAAITLMGVGVLWILSRRRSTPPSDRR